MSRFVPLGAALLAGVALAVAGCSSGGNTSTAENAGDRSATASAAVQVFDETVVHAITVEFDQADYEAMMATFVASGDKEWISAAVTIDGVAYKDVGLRLKGNSSLNALRGRGDPGVNQAAPAADDTGESDYGFTAETAKNPEQLPWLIRLDRFVEGQEHQGKTDIVVRSNSSKSALNEAVALDLLEAAGLASQEAVAIGFTVNGSAPLLRMAIEHPDEDDWQDDAFDGKGALYKAESTGDWSYRGDDPAAYTEVFDQEGGSSVADLTPLIAFLDFINNADDEAFAAELPERLDVQAFARYLAMMELLGNFDDIDGPGNNSYLWWDPSTEQFTIVPWDMNLALGGSIDGGRGGGFTPGGMPGGAPPQGGFTPGQRPEGANQGQGGFTPGQLPQGATPPQGQGGFGQARANPLVQRFHANATFEALYEEQLASLRAELLESGKAGEILAARVRTLAEGAGELIAADTLTSEAAAVSAALGEG